MYDFRELLNRFWVTREADKELYFALKRAVPEYRKFAREQLGWNLIVDEKAIKLEKVPPRAMPWMGIESFTETLDYCLLCALLLFLADLDDGEQFLLSTLTEALETFLREVRPVDWTRFPHRKALVRVLQYAQEVGLLLVFDGDSGGFGSDREQEVLYENTGLSRHFPVHFGRDILSYRTVEDFEASEGADAERGWQRVRRVYRQLVLSPGLYWSEENSSDYEYIKNQRRRVGKTLEEILGGELQVNKNGAYLIFEQNDRSILTYPESKAITDAALLLCTRLREQIAAGVYQRGCDDLVRLSRREFLHEVERCRTLCGDGWGKVLRELDLDRLCEELTAYMSVWSLLEEQGDDLLLYPAVGKWTGAYPADYQEKNREGDTDGPVEDA